MAARPYLLREVAWHTVRETRYEVALLPWGATEAHNLHLPYATDVIASEAVAAAAAGVAWDRGAKVIVLPAMPFGVQTGQLDIPLCINLNPTSQLAVLRDVAGSLAGQGVKTLVVMNGHGGNDFKWMIRELQPETSIFLCAVEWQRAVDHRQFFGEPGDHAGELETSVMLHLAPELVRPLAEAGAGAARKSKLKAMREGWAWAPRPWTKVTTDTGVGDPKAATAGKGALYVAAVVEQLAAFLVDLARANPDTLYE